MKLKLLLQNIFSIKNNPQKSHIIITILGLKIKLKIQKNNVQNLSNHEYYIDVQFRYFLKRLETITGNNLIFIGDSIFNMFNVESIFKAINFGISGISLKDLLKHPEFLNSIKNQNIVLGIGINDVGGNSIDVIIKNYMQIIEILKHNQNNIFISEILPVDEKILLKKRHMVKLNSDIQKINTKLQQLVKTNKNYIHSGKYLKEKHLNKLNPKYSIGDGLHLNKEGYKELEKALKEVLF